MQQVTIQPLEEAENVVKANELQTLMQVEVNSILLVLAPIFHGTVVISCHNKFFRSQAFQ
jgi:hypothetical protein